MATAIIVAGGKGVRMNTTVRKQYLSLGTFPVLCHTLLKFENCSAVKQIVLVIPEQDIAYCSEHILSPLNLSKYVIPASGGNDRQESVYNGLCAVDDQKGIVVIHDGVRPFVKPDLISECIRGAKNYGACIAAIPAVDTLKRVDKDFLITNTVPRDDIWQAQTPQAFQYDIIRMAHEKAIQDQFMGTDDASLLERMRVSVKIIQGSPYNIKITTREDLELAKNLKEFINHSTGNL